MKFEEIKKILSDYKREMRDRFKVKEIGVFGSYVRNEETEKSDVDLLVEFYETPGGEFIDPEEYLGN